MGWRAKFRGKDRRGFHSRPASPSEEGEAEKAQNQDQAEAGEDAPFLPGRGEGHRTWDVRP